MTPELRRLQTILRECSQLALDAKATRTMELKPDGSIVTNVDRMIEKYLREKLSIEWMGTNVWGEEYGYEPMGANGLWLVDPIDGTSNFAYGNPLWGISIALAQPDGIQLGAIALPELNIELLSERGHGAYWNDERLPQWESKPILHHELISCNDRIMKLMNIKVEGKSRLCGAFVIDGSFTVKQWFRAMYSGGEKLYDIAAVVLAARETGMPINYANGDVFDETKLLKDIYIQQTWKIG